MPKVLRIINRFNLGGPTYNATYLTKYLSTEFETMLVGGEKDESEDSSLFILQKEGLSPVIIPEMRRSINPLNDVRAYLKLVRIIRKFKPDIVHTHAAKAGTLGRLAALRCGVPVIVHTFHGHVFHAYFSRIKTTIFKTIERWLAAKTSGIIAISEKQKQEICGEHKIAPLNRCTIVPLGFDLSRFQENLETKRNIFRAQYKLAPNQIAIAIVGRLVPVKNHALFLQALQLVLAQTTQSVKAFIVGDGEIRAQIEAKAQELGIAFSTEKDTEHIHPLVFTSWIKEVDVVYAGVDIVCLTSVNEGTPVSLIEAQASNTPIVSTRVGGIEDVVIEEQTALLSPTNDAPAFARQLLRVIENAELRNTLSQNGWEFVRNRFHYTRLVNDMERLYRELLKK